MRNLIQIALEDDLIPGDVAELIAGWPLIHFFRLKPGETAVVAGAYKGKLMQALLELYPSIRVVGYEPQTWAFEAATERLQAMQRISWSLHNSGLGDETRDHVPIGEFGTDAASFINTGPGSREQGVGNLVEVGEALKDLDEIGLMVLNVEGYEFTLIRHMITAGIMPRIKRLAVQWHLGLGGSDSGYDADKMDSILGSVGYASMHKLVYDERPTWTYSQRRRP